MATKAVKKELLNDDIKVKVNKLCKLEIPLKSTLGLEIWACDFFPHSYEWIDSKFIAHALNIYLLFRVGGETAGRALPPALRFDLSPWRETCRFSFLQSKTFMVFICSRVTTANWKTSRFIALSAFCLPHHWQNALCAVQRCEDAAYTALIFHLIIRDIKHLCFPPASQTWRRKNTFPSFPPLYDDDERFNYKRKFFLRQFYFP